MIAAAQKAKGPAEAATSPDRGSTNSGKEKDMNKAVDTTPRLEKRARPTDKEILDGLEVVDWKITELRRAAMVATEYAHMEFRSGNDGCFLKSCLLSAEQVSGIQYMLQHLRDLADQAENAADKAYGREAVQ